MVIHNYWEHSHKKNNSEPTLDYIFDTNEGEFAIRGINKAELVDETSDILATEADLDEINAFISALLANKALIKVRQEEPMMFRISLILTLCEDIGSYFKGTTLTLTGAVIERPNSF